VLVSISLVNAVLATLSRFIVGADLAGPVLIGVVKGVQRTVELALCLQHPGRRVAL